MVGQQPNVPVGVEDLPRHTPHPEAPAPWSPNRPGDLAGPTEVPTGAAFGRPAPDAGYAWRLVNRWSLPGGRERRSDVAAAVAAVVMARAGALGRAPVPQDVEAAIILIGLNAPDVATALAGIAHDHTRLSALVGAVPAARLVLPVARLRG